MMVWISPPTMVTPFMPIPTAGLCKPVGTVDTASVFDHGNGLKTRYAHLSTSMSASDKRCKPDRDRRCRLPETPGTHLHLGSLERQTRNPLNYL